MFKNNIFNFLVLMAVTTSLMGCYDNCDETVYVENSDGTTSIECVIYNN